MSNASVRYNIYHTPDINGCDGNTMYIVLFMTQNRNRLITPSNYKRAVRKIQDSQHKQIVHIYSTNQKFLGYSIKWQNNASCESKKKQMQRILISRAKAPSKG